MPDEETNPTGTPAAPEAAQEPNPGQDLSTLPDWAREALSKANREAASYRTKVRELEPRAQLANQLEEASKTESQRLTEQAENARRDAEQARGDALRYRLAARHGITEDNLDLLGAGTEEQLTERAERIAAMQKAASTAAPPAARRPVEELRPGATPSTVPTDDEDYAQYAQFFSIPPTRK